MQTQAATIQDARAWMTKQNVVISRVLATGTLARGSVAVERYQFISRTSDYAIFHWRPTECKLLGLLPISKLKFPGNLLQRYVYVRLRDLMPYTPSTAAAAAATTAETKQEYKPPTSMPGEFTIAEAEAGLKLRVNPTLEFLRCDTPEMQRLDAVSYKVALLAAVLFPQENVRDWMAVELKIAEQRPITDLSMLRLNEDVIQRQPTANRGHRFAASTGLIVESGPLVQLPASNQDVLRALDPDAIWMGPLPFELMSPAMARSHRVYLSKGQAWIPAADLNPRLVQHRIATQLRVLTAQQQQHQTDERLLGLVKRWRMLLRGQQQLQMQLSVNFRWEDLPPCVHSMLQEYPVYDTRRVVTNILAWLGVRDVAQFVMPRWQRAIETKHPDRATQQQTEIKRGIEGLQKTYKKACYTCYSLQRLGKCPLHKATEPRETIKQCFGASIEQLKVTPSPVLFVHMNVRHP
jgi:hypothetical protein